MVQPESSAGDKGSFLPRSKEDLFTGDKLEPRGMRGIY